MINDYIPATVRSHRTFLERRFSVEHVSTEILLYALLFLASLGLHLWQLDVKAMHHDESIHAWISYRFFTGQGPFNCAGQRQADTYCYDPVYHGPSLYILTALAYFLFGDGDAQARLPMALAGVALVPMAWTLRPFIGRSGALIAAMLMMLSPSILYYTRFARHDALVLLWSLFMLVGLFRFLRYGGAFNLALATAGLALTWATHELVFILIFIGGSFLGFRLLWEWQPRFFRIAAVVAFILAVVCIIAIFAVSEQQSPTLYEFLHRFLGPALLLGVGVLLVFPMARRWNPAPVVLDRFAATWRNDRRTFWVAGLTFLAIFALLFTTFFAYPIGFLDGWYQGINYWLGSQHTYARGDQPWFYYLMLLPLYEPIALIFALIGLGWLVFGRSVTQTNAGGSITQSDGKQDGDGELSTEKFGNGAAKIYAAPAAVVTPSLLVFFLGYWFIQSFVAFSWAGEKMPWLLTHITLPAILLAAWVLGKFIDQIAWRRLRPTYLWIVPLLASIVGLMTLVTAYHFSGPGETIAGIRERLQGVIPLLIAGLSLFGLLTIASSIGWRIVLRLSGLAFALILLLYGIRASSLVVYHHPDTPIEPLIYTQTAPEVRIVVDQIKQIAINESRNERTAQDPTGSYSMPMTLDGGASQSGGEGSLAWPMQWYLRHFQNVRWLDVDTNPTINPDSRIVMLYKPHATSEIVSQLEDEYVQTQEGVFNWWFPEYTDFTSAGPGQTGARGYKSLAAEGVGVVLSWPFIPDNWPTLVNYLLYRELPLELRGREMVVYMRRNVVPGGAATATSTPTETIAAEAVLAEGQFNNPRGMAVDDEGNVLVADANNHQIVVLAPDGQQVRTLGSFGNGDGELYEPSGVSVDHDGNVYVADTWNSRIVKFGPDGTFLKAWGTSTTAFGDPVVDPENGQSVQRYATDNQGLPELNEQNPLGFFGPRNLLVYDDRVYIADTGNSRIVVTDREGNLKDQFGSRGSGLDQLHEPIGLAIDEQNRLYIGDTWNGRIQVFQLSNDGMIEPTPLATINVPGWTAQTYHDPYIAAAPDGGVWASQGARNTVAEFDTDYQQSRRIKSEPPLLAPKGIAWGPDGSLYVVNSGQNQILRLPVP
jgi:uncharacterized protein (TIGR03663 family)